MSNAVWVILYTVADADRQDYLDWFHQVHIPDKLARPGHHQLSLIRLHHRKMWVHLEQSHKVSLLTR